VKTFDAILDRLKQLAANVGGRDVEAAHSEADALLMDALLLTGVEPEKVRQIIDTYQDVEKWYA